MFAAVLVATTGFVVLTGAATTSRLVASGVIEDNYRPPYDILVRPAAARAETATGVLPPSQLAGPDGGISLEQWQQIKEIPGVEVAAPLALLGLADVRPGLRVDLTDLVDPDAERQLIAITPRILAERGLTTLDAAPRYVYITHRPLVPPSEMGQTLVYTDGTQVDVRQSAKECPGTGGGGPLEVQRDGSRRQVCTAVSVDAAPDRRLTHVSPILAYQILPDRTFRLASVLTRGQPLSAVPSTPRLEVELPALVPAQLTAVDPVEEARLVGIDRAVQRGRYLDEHDSLAPAQADGRALPVIASDKLAIDQTIDITVARMMGGQTTRAVLGGVEEQWRLLRDAEREPLHEVSYDLAEVYRTAAEAAVSGTTPLSPIDSLFRPTPSVYAELPDGSYQVPSGAPDSADTAKMWRDSWLATDVHLRTGRWVSLDGTGQRWFVTPVGLFAPEQTRGTAEAHVGLDPYRSGGLVGGDNLSRTLLDNQPLLPNDNPQGFPDRTPCLVTTLTAAKDLLAAADPALAAAPLSAIRVRVANVGGFDAVSRERVRMVADEIVGRTGLSVEILLGSSTVPTAIQLPAGNLGRPALTVLEPWTKQGVLTQVVTVVDRKNLILLGLLLVVCTLLVGNAVSTAVRGRRRELAILACVGWPAWRLAALVHAEAAALGLVAGLVGAAAAGPLADLAGVRISGAVALLCVPIAVLLTATAAVGPALRAARTRSAAALHPLVAPARRATPHRTVAGVALANLARVPGRTLAGAASLATGVGAVTLITAALWAFQDGMVGSLLGQAVSVQVRAVDLVAVAGILLFGVLGTIDVMYLNIRERAAEFATLRATGWPEAALNRLVGYEALGIGVLGALLGVTAGTGAAALLVGVFDERLAVVALAVSSAAVLLAGLAGLVPATLLRRLPTARMLTEE